MKLFLLFAATLTLGACVRIVGRAPAELPQIVHNAGANGTVSTTSIGVTGELIAADDSAVVMYGARVVSVRTSAITYAAFRDISSRPRPMSPEVLRELRLRSRYPHGIPPAALAQLLESRQQQAPDVVDR